MSAFIAEDQIQRVRDATDIVALIREYIPLQRAGAAFKALCPFHEEKTPSFFVNPGRQMFKCFGCGAGGDAISFVMKHDGLSFYEALNHLARRAGIELEESAGARMRRAEAKTIFDVMAWAADSYAQWLWKSEGAARAREYLRNRKFTDATIRRFGLGYAPDAWDELVLAARRKGISDQLLIKAGLALRREGGGSYDRFRNRIMFAISDVRGRIIGFGARSMDGSEPKYINSPETPVFQKGRVLYGLREALDALRKTRRAIIMEGYTDVIMAHQQGLTAAVAVLGTALTREHVRLLRRYVDEAILLFDGDEAGQNSAERSVDAFAEEGMPVRIGLVPGNLDPCDLLAQEGAGSLQRVTDSAESLVAFKLRRARAAHGGRIDGLGALDGVLTTVALMSDAVAQDAAIREIAAATQISIAAVAARVRGLKPAVAAGVRRAGQVPVCKRDPERELLEVMLAEPAAVEWARAKLNLKWLTQPAVRRVVERAFALAEAGIVPDASTLLARTTDVEERTLLEGALALEPPTDVNCRAWCDELVARLEALHAERESCRCREELHRVASGASAAGETLTPEEREALRRVAELARQRQARRLGLGGELVMGSGER